jgi:hypothetical protein
MSNDVYKKQQGGEFQDHVKLRGCLEIALLDAKDGREIERVKINNTVVTSGRSYVLSRLMSSSPQTDQINAIGIGTSTTAPTTGDTLLTSESLRVSIASFVTTGLTANPPSWQAQCTFLTNQCNTTLGEAGLFNSTSSNVQTMLSHVTFSTINKTTSNTLAISYTISN